MNQRDAIIKAWRERLIADGRCMRCEGMRGDDGTTTLCRLCADKKNTTKGLRTLRCNSEKKRITKRQVSLLEAIQQEEKAYQEEDERQQERLARFRHAVIEDERRRQEARRIAPHKPLEQGWHDFYEYLVGHDGDA